MRYKIVTIHDRAAGAYGVPSFVISTGAAIRSFSDEINKKDTPLGAHPEDFDLYYLGELDDNSGEFIQDGPRIISIGKDCVKV